MLVGAGLSFDAVDYLSAAKKSGRRTRNVAPAIYSEPISPKYRAIAPPAKRKGKGKKSYDDGGSIF